MSGVEAGVHLVKALDRIPLQLVDPGVRPVQAEVEPPEVLFDPVQPTQHLVQLLQLGQQRLAHRLRDPIDQPHRGIA